jgi:hypothetical protein
VLKEKIKELSKKQTKLKKQRKTGPYDIVRTSWGDVDFSKMPRKVKDSWDTAEKVQRNKGIITAALNLYHEIRGSDYRHNIPEHASYDYHKAYKELKEELDTVTEDSMM